MRSWRPFMSAIVLFVAVLGWARVAEAGICQCRRTEAGVCERWSQRTVPYTIYAPAETPDGITNDQLRAEVEAAFETWQSVQCATCSQAVGAQCEPVPCEPNPLGIRFEFAGFANKPTLATQCLMAGAPSPCPGMAADTVQVALIRNEADWQLDPTKVTQTILTVKQSSGRIIDADIVLKDSKHSFCLDKCGPGQYQLRAVLLREIGHLLGMGSSDDAEALLAADFKPGAHVSNELSAADMGCVCQIYRSSMDLADCQTPTEAIPGAVGCQASQPASSGKSAWWLGMVALGLLTLRRYRNGRNSPVPTRRA